jgi:hypothetical protein
MSVGIISIIMTSIGSVIVLASRALPAAPGASRSVAPAAAAAEQLVSELRFATGVLEAGERHIIFTVPDRSGNGQDETIAWEWAGPARPLTRTYNGGTPVVLLEALGDFGISYTRRLYRTTEVINAVVESSEVLLCGFNGWPGVSPALNSAQITGTAWASEKFVVDRITFPEDTISWRITRVSMRLRRSASTAAAVTIGIHPPSTSGGFLPALLPIGTPAVIPGTTLTTGVNWQDAFFTDVEFTRTDLRDFVLLVKPELPTNLAYLEYYNANNAPTDAYVFQMTSDAGLTWIPTSNRQRNDAPFYVYGTYRRATTVEVHSDRYTLRHVSITLQPGPSAAARLTTGVQFANQPEIPAP